MRRLFVMFGIVALTACSQSEPKLPEVVATPMPFGESWAGVYTSAELGELHLAPAKGRDAYVGFWKRGDDTRWGHVTGHADGNVLRVTWREHWLDPIGPDVAGRGDAYFIYVRANAPLDYELDGEYAAAGADAAKRWTWKKASKTPDLAAMTRWIRAHVLATDDSMHAELPSADGRIVELNAAMVP